MDRDYVWTETRADAVAAFGSSPRPEDDAAVMAAFAEDPVRVIALLEDVGQAYERGEARYPWGLVRSRLERKAAAEVKVPAAKVRAGKVNAAEQWMRAAGIHYDRASEIEAELFDRGGKLHAYADDEELRERMADLWRELRGKGETVEREERERTARWKGSRPPLPPLRGEPARSNPFL